MNLIKNLIRSAVVLVPLGGSISAFFTRWIGLISIRWSHFYNIFCTNCQKSPNKTLSRRQKAFFPHQSARGASAVFLKKKNYKVKVKNFFTRARKNYSFYELIVVILKLNVKNNYCWQWRGHKILFMWPFLKNSGILILIGLILNYLFIFIYSN